jgi:hypothetical protein
MRLIVDMSGSQDPRDDLNILAAMTDSIADLLSQSSDPPSEGVALALSLFANMTKGIAAEMPNPYRAD